MDRPWQVSDSLPDRSEAIAHIGSRAWEQPKLNERPIFVRSMFLWLAFVQACAHLYVDRDRALLPAKKRDPEQPVATRTPLPLKMQLTTLLPSIIQQSAIRAAASALSGPFVYYLLLRSSAWTVSLRVAKIFFSLPRNSRPSTVPYVGDLIPWYLLHGFLLVFLWEFTNEAFDIYVTRRPLKRGQPLTNDSKNPNGSLISGLKMRKEVPKTMAAWELDLIAASVPERRATIFLDSTGTVFDQICGACTAHINSINSRIAAFHEYTHPQPSAQQQAQQPQFQTLPRISQKPLQQDNILQAPLPPADARQKLAYNVGEFAKSHGQSPGANPLQITMNTVKSNPRTQKLLDYGKDKVLSDVQRRKISAASPKPIINTNLLKFLMSPFGIPFRQTIHRRLNSIVLGTPYSTLDSTLDATSALTGLAVHSLKEDRYGQVSKHVPNIIRTLVTTIANVENFPQTLSVHWTDVDFNDQFPEQRKSEEVRVLLAALRSGLADVLAAFGEYADNLGLSVEEMTRAKEVASSGEKRETAGEKRSGEGQENGESNKKQAEMREIGRKADRERSRSRR